MKPEEFSRNVRPSVLSNKNFNKIFVIGYNKTGTTTMERVLRLYGYSMPQQQEQEARLTKQVFRTNYEEFVSFVRRYDAFQDLPFSQEQTYVVADALFPNSKFILTERDSEKWFSSMSKFTKKLFNIDNLKNLTEKDLMTKFRYLFPGYLHSNHQRILTNFKKGLQSETQWNKLFDKEYYIKVYEERNNQVKKYFMGMPGKLLVLDISEEDNTSSICRFLNIPRELVVGMPHENKSS